MLGTGTVSLTMVKQTFNAKNHYWSRWLKITKLIVTKTLAKANTIINVKKLLLNSIREWGS